MYISFTSEGRYVGGPAERWLWLWVNRVGMERSLCQMEHQNPGPPSMISLSLRCPINTFLNHPRTTWTPLSQGILLT